MQDCYTAKEALAGAHTQRSGIYALLRLKLTNDFKKNNAYHKMMENTLNKGFGHK